MYCDCLPCGRWRSRTACCFPVASDSGLHGVSPMSSRVPHAVLTDGGGGVNLICFFLFFSVTSSHGAGSFPAFGLIRYLRACCRRSARPWAGWRRSCGSGACSRPGRRPLGGGLPQDLARPGTPLRRSLSRWRPCGLRALR